MCIRIIHRFRKKTHIHRIPLSVRFVCVMSATGEVEKTNAEQPQVEAPATEKPAVKPVKEKKPKAPKEKKPKAPKTAAHPPYFEMIKEALVAMNEKNGSSPYAIAKFMEEKHKAVLPANFRKILGLQLKNSAAKGKLIKIKASYKLSDAKNVSTDVKKPKPAKANAEKKAPASAPKSPVKATRAATKKTEAVAKKPPKKAKKAAAPAKPKQPKSIKSPAAKRAKKAAAA